MEGFFIEATNLPPLNAMSMATADDAMAGSFVIAKAIVVSVFSTSSKDNKRTAGTGVGLSGCTNGCTCTTSCTSGGDGTGGGGILGSLEAKEAIVVVATLVSVKSLFVSVVSVVSVVGGTGNPGPTFPAAVL